MLRGVLELHLKFQTGRLAALRIQEIKPQCVLLGKVCGVGATEAPRRAGCRSEVPGCEAPGAHSRVIRGKKTSREEWHLSANGVSDFDRNGAKQCCYSSEVT